MDPLFRELRRFAAALAPHGIPVILGGGYGLLLRQRRLEEREADTLMALPAERTTRDLDVFLTVEMLANAEKAEAVKRALVELDYKVIPGKESYQFVRMTGDAGFDRGVKIDLLAPVPQDMEEYPELKLDRIRPNHKKVKNRNVPGLNAFGTPEAFSVTEGMEAVGLGVPGEGDGDPPGGERTAELEAYLPHPFTYLLLKLFAYRDRQDDDTTDFRYHAYDLYRIIAMMTEEDVAQVEGYRDRFPDHPIMRDAREIVASLFSNSNAKGAVALQAYSQVVGADLGVDDVEQFVNYLAEFLPPPTLS